MDASVRLNLIIIIIFCNFNHVKIVEVPLLCQRSLQGTVSLAQVLRPTSLQHDSHLALLDHTKEKNNGANDRINENADFKCKMSMKSCLLYTGLCDPFDFHAAFQHGMHLLAHEHEPLIAQLRRPGCHI